MSKGREITPEQNEQALAAIEAAIAGGLTETKLGEKLGVSQQAVSLWRKRRRVGRDAYEALLGRTVVPADDALERALAADWWIPAPVPDPDVYDQIRREARQARDKLDDAVPESYWVAYLRRRAEEAAMHATLDAAGAPKRRRSGRGNGSASGGSR